MGWIAGWFARSALGRWTIGALAMLVVIALYLARRDRRVRGQERDAAELERRRADAETRRRMDNADVGRADPDDDAGWLLRRGRGSRIEPPLVRGDGRAAD